MGEHLAIETRIAQASKRWPHVQFKRRTDSWADGPCPWCGGDDRFVIRSSGWYECRKCARDGWIDEDDPKPPDKEKLLEARIAALEQKQREHDRRLSALERMARCQDHLQYHDQMDQFGWRDMWYEKGVTDELIDAYRLGVCLHCRTDRPDERMSLTIPVVNRNRLVNIRHRLQGGDQSDKYRPHRPGLGNTLFGADDIYSDDTGSILIIEGEIKRIVVKDRLGGNVIGTMGKSGFQRAWASRFERFGEVLICLDPDAHDKARQMAGWIGKRARIVSLPVKSDDFFTYHHGTVEQFNEFVKMARKVA